MHRSEDGQEELSPPDSANSFSIPQKTPHSKKSMKSSALKKRWSDLNEDEDMDMKIIVNTNEGMHHDKENMGYYRGGEDDYFLSDPYKKR